MIACPLCSGPTIVVETRAVGDGARRRRKCAKETCAGRITTLEVIVTRRHARGRGVLIPRRVLAQLQRLIAALGDSA